MGGPVEKIALSCSHVGKTFAVHREQNIWRLLFGFTATQRGPTIEALRDISMEVPRGKIVGILGRNGAGKSTLLRLLGQVYTPTTGRIEIFGQIAGLFELGGAGNPNLTGREYAMRYLRLMGVPKKHFAELLADIAEFSELGEAFEQRIRTYSSGMGARLYFAVATAYQNEIYLIDELLAVGDEHFQAKCWRRMRDRLLNGASGVLVTHDWSAIIKLCELACVLEDGCFSFAGPSDRAVVSYLKLPPPDSSTARFFASLPAEYSVRAKEDLCIRLSVEILENVAVDFAISIEVLRIGIGWEIAILSEYLPVGDSKGIYDIEVVVPSVPLAPGSYSLNLFLSQCPLNRSGPRKGLDVRSWTYGNGFVLRVEGEATHSAASLPFAARRLESFSV